MYEHKRPLFAFVLVAVICGIVVGTTMKSQAIFGVSVPWRQTADASPSIPTESPTLAPAVPSKTPSAAVTVTSAKATGGAEHATRAVDRAQAKGHRTHHQSVHHSPPVHHSTTDGGRHPGQPHHTTSTPSDPPKTDQTRGLHVVTALTGPSEPTPVDPSTSPASPAPTGPVVPEGE